MSEPITEDWLRQAGFKWHEFERSGGKHWLLWLDRAIGADGEELGLELAYYAPFGYWHCWFRSDLAGRYHRFIHVRHLTTTAELLRLIEGITGQDWSPANVLYGQLWTAQQAGRLRAAAEGRIDRKWMTESHPRAKWSEVEKDDTRGGALPEHMEVAEKERLRREKLMREERIAEDRRGDPS